MPGLCNNFTQYGSCRFGDRCMYRHGPNDTRDLSQLQRTRTDNSNYSRGRGGYANRGGGRGGKGGKGRGGGGGGAAAASAVKKTFIPTNLSDTGLKVFVENRVRAKLEHQKVNLLKDLLERGSKGSSWRCFDEKLDEIVAFGGTGLRSTLLGITGKSQNKPDTIFVFFFEPSTSKQETEIKALKTSKANKGAGGLYEGIFKQLKGTVALSAITIAKSKEELAEEKKEQEKQEQQAHAEATSVEALDAQVAAIALAQKTGQVETGEPSYDDLDAFM